MRLFTFKFYKTDTPIGKLGMLKDSMYPQLSWKLHANRIDVFFARASIVELDLIDKKVICLSEYPRMEKVIETIILTLNSEC